jgi:hypothetical protein
MKKLETITNKESGITYYPIYEELESIGKHFFKDQDLALICCPSLASGGYDADSMEYVEDWIINELSKAENAKLKKISHRLYVRIEESLEQN